MSTGNLPSFIDPSDGTAGVYQASTITTEAVASMLNIDPEATEGIMNRVVATSQQMRDLFAQTAAHDVTNRIVANSSRPEYFCSTVTDQVDINRLQSTYPNYTIKSRHSDTRDSSSNHAYAREERRLVMKMIYEQTIGMKKGPVKLGKSRFSGCDYDVLVKDVGGNASFHLANGYANTHCCCPVINTADVVRDQAHKDFIRKKGADLLVSGSPSARSLKSMLTGSNKHRCNLKSQQCRVKAPIVTFIHSSYDMTIGDIGATLDLAEAETAHVVLHYSPMIKLSSSGTLEYQKCRWVKFDDNKKRYIRFAFDDSEFHYVHDYTTYCALMHLVRFVTPAGRAFIVHRSQVRNGTAILRLEFDERTYVPRELVYLHYVCEEEREFNLLCTYHYDAVPRSALNINTTDHIRPVIVPIKKKFYDDVITYIRGIDSTKLSIAKVQPAYAAMSARTSINSAQVMASSGVPSEYYQTVLVSLYFIVFRDNYKAGKLLEAFRKEEEACRNANAVGNLFTKPYHILVRLLRCLFWSRNQKAHFSQDENHPLANSIINVNDLDVEGCSTIDVDAFINTHVNSLDFSTSTLHDTIHLPIDYVKGLYRSFLQRGIRKTKYPISLIEGPRAVECSDVIPEMFLDDSTCAPLRNEEPYIFYPQLQTTLMKKFRWAYSDAITETVRYEMPRAVFDTCTLSSHNTAAVPGDGDCFFHCFITLTNHYESPTAMRERLSKSRYLSAFTGDDIARLVARLSTPPIDGRIPEAGWVTGDIISLVCMEYTVSVCVHSGDHECCIYNPNCVNRIHVQLSDGHYTPIVQRKFSSHVELAESSDLSSLVRSSPGFAEMQPTSVIGLASFPMCENYQSALEIVLDTFGDDLNDAIVASKETSFHLRLGTFGFDSLYALMLMGLYDTMKDSEIVQSNRVLHVPAFRNVLLVGDKDLSSSQYFVDVMHAPTTLVKRVTRRDRSNVSNVINKQLLRQVVSSASTDVAIERLGRTFYDCVQVNPVYYSDFLSPVDNKRHDMHVASCLPALRKLANDGTFTVAVASPFTAFTANLAFRLTKFFKTVSYVVPTNKPEHSVWGFLLCRGFKSMSDNQYLEWFSPFYNVNDPAYQDLWTSVPSGLLDVFDSLYAKGLGELCDALSDIQLSMNNACSPVVDNTTQNFLEKFYPKRTDMHVGGSLGDWVSWARSYMPSRDQRDIPVKVSLPTTDVLPFGKKWFEKTYPTMPKASLMNPNFIASSKAVYTRYYVNTVLNSYYSRGILSRDGPLLYDQIESLLSTEELDQRLTHFDVYFFANYLHYISDPSFVMFKFSQKTYYFEHTVTTDDFLNPLDQLLIGVGKVSLTVGRRSFVAANVIPPVVTDLAKPGVLVRSGLPLVTKVPTRPLGDYMQPPSLRNVFSQYAGVCEEAYNQGITSTQLRDELRTAVARPGTSSGGADPSLGIAELTDGGDEFAKQVYPSKNYYGRNQSILAVNKIRMNMFEEYVNLLKTHVANVQGMCRDLLNKTASLPSFSSSSKTDPSRVAWMTQHRYMYMDRNDESTKPVVVRNGSVLTGPDSDLDAVRGARYVFVPNTSSGEFVRVTDRLPPTFAYLHEMKILTEYDILKAAKTCAFKPPDCPIGTIQAGPGCGKSYSIIESAKAANAPCLVLTTVREGAASLSEKLKDYPRVTVKTVDSFIMHSDGTRYPVVYIDEAMMTHPGKILLAAYLAGPGCVKLYGDVFQIPFINRVMTKPPPKYTQVSMAFPIIKVLAVSYRCPRDVVLYLSAKYSKEFKAFDTPPKSKCALRTKNDAPCPSVSVTIIPTVKSVPVEVDTVYLTFTHPDSDVLSAHLGRPVSTIHEFQGNQSSDIVVVRLTPTPVPVDGGKDLFKQEGHVTTAISRHTKTLRYFTVCNDRDGIVEFFKQSSKYSSNDLDSAAEFGA
nr:methyltransferase-helicase [Blunervirus sp.]